MSRTGTLLLRAVAVVGALVYAALAIGNGLDRLAFDRPELASAVPAPFAVNALEVLGEAQLHKAPRAAEPYAEHLVARAPVEPFSTALLGAARYAAGDGTGADQAFRVAGQLGWRIPATQAYWRQAALAAGDFPVAAQRLDALLRRDPELLRDAAALAPFERDARGEAALAVRLAKRPPWLGWYTGEVDPVPADVLARRLPSLMMLGDRGVVLGCDAIAPGVRKLVAAGMTGQAEALARKHCPGGRLRG
jgi:hypothetical protein